MCFSQAASFSFAALGLTLALYAQLRFKNSSLAVGIFFFFTMELLQGFQYFWIDDCSNPINKALTVVGFLHICLQPYFTHVLSSSMATKPRIIGNPIFFFFF
jgi:hypothetical protein